MDVAINVTTGRDVKPSLSKWSDLPGKHSGKQLVFEQARTSKETEEFYIQCLTGENFPAHKIPKDIDFRNSGK